MHIQKHFKCKRLPKLQLQGRREFDIVAMEHTQPFSTQPPTISSVNPPSAVDLDIATAAEASQVYLVFYHSYVHALKSHSNVDELVALWWRRIGMVIVFHQAILGEINVEKLIDKLMGVVMENTGATKSLLILQEEGGDQFVKARAVVDSTGMVS